ncbi:hypothetical protein M3649_08045 [Ureibacillus chungkukjangi]|uniref:hypothetical protein n=1 Tax=Ureibacillus chungkukjangi TaxID=1202712 RepID=UPI00203CC084|nr:hypothetical protein [Ureibacillus chungkukjangi]MCM3388086.1 hypothetical protein [Ureibacillus chungkukjangi]
MLLTYSYFHNQYIQSKKGGIEIKKFIFIVGFTLILGGILTFINHPQAENSKPSDKDTTKLFKDLHSELSGKYDIGATSIASNQDFTTNDIIIPINGSQEYYDSVKDEVESLVNKITKTTPFENYSVKVEKNKIEQFLNKSAKDEMKLRYEITQTVHDSLSDYYINQIGDIGITDSASELIIEVHTLLNGQESTALVKEMEDKLNIIFQQKLSSNLLIKDSSIYFHIYNEDGDKIN